MPLSSKAVAQATVNVPLNYWGYSFLERLEAKKLIQSYELRTRPISRHAFASLLHEVSNGLKNKSVSLSTSDQKLLEQLQSDFEDELGQHVFGHSKSSEPHTIHWHEHSSWFYFDTYARQNYFYSLKNSNKKPTSEITLGGILRGSLQGFVGFNLDVRNTLIKGGRAVSEENFNPSTGLPVVLSRSNMYQDQALAYWQGGKSWLHLEFGRDEISWGPGSHGGLAISKNIPPAEMIRLNTRFNRFKLTYLHAFLRSGLGSKYLVAHRLDIRLLPYFFLGLSETTVYGKRNVEFAYLNPIMPFHIAQHHLGDKDNKTMSFDITTFPLAGIKAYTEFFIDDMTSTESLTGYFGNKFAFLSGLHWADPLSLPNVDLKIEYARIEPYVYTHWDSINIYTNYDKLIGHWLGPNGDDFFMSIGWQLNKNFRFEAFLESMRKGKGTVSTQTRPDQGNSKKFLDEVVEKRKMMGGKITGQLRRDFFVSVSYSYSDLYNKSLPEKINSTEKRFFMEFYFNY